MTRALGGFLAPIVALGAALSACRGAAAPSARTCGAGDVVVHGACVGAADAQRFCGKSAAWTGGACVLRACPPGEVRDELDGACLGARALRASAENDRVPMGEGDVPTCLEGTTLRVAAGHARCAEEAAPAPRDTCGPGAAYDARAHACLAVARGAGAVDLGAWTRALFGEDGGAGSAELCARAAADPAAYGLPSGSLLEVTLEIELVVPDNDVTLARARVRANHPLPAAADARVESAVDADVELLRALGGTASAASASTRVRCVVRAGSAPIAARPPLEDARLRGAVEAREAARQPARKKKEK